MVHTTETLHRRIEALLANSLRVVKQRGGERALFGGRSRSQEAEYRGVLRDLDEVSALLREYLKAIYEDEY